jgi:phytoene dehydrogenase-like protein
MPAYDAVVVGAGHNGLTCAAYLARAGRRVLVLERGPVIGGMTRSADLAAPGFLSDMHASGYLVARLSPTPADLGLDIPMAVPDPNWVQVFPDGRALVIGRDVAATAASLAQFSPRDGEAWRGLYADYLEAKPAIVRGMFSAPEALAETLAAPGGAAGYRGTMLSARGWAEERFESPEARLFFTSAALHFGLAPDDPMGGTLAWLFVAAIQDVGCGIVRGGMGQVGAALAAVVEASGGAVRTGAEVAEKSVVNFQ